MHAARRASDLLLRCDPARRRHIVTVRATMARQTREHQPHDVQQLRRSAERAAHPGHARALMQRERRRNIAHLVDTRLLRLCHAPPRVRRQRFQIPPRPFGVEHAERERGLARSRNARNADDFMQRNVDGYILQIVHARPSDFDRQWSRPAFASFFCHFVSHLAGLGYFLLPATSSRSSQMGFAAKSRFTRSLNRSLISSNE